MNAADYIAAFRDAMHGAGLQTDAPIIDDGKLHRVHVDGDRPGSKNGWYVLHGDGLPAGAFGCWKTGESQNWCAKPDRTQTPAERAGNQQRYAVAKRERDEQQQRDFERARLRSAALWKLATPCIAQGDRCDSFAHPYLARKGIGAHGVRLYRDCLVIPARDADGVLHTLQFIDAEGNKRFLSGGKKRGCYFSIGKANGILYLAEGFATAATIHEATGDAVAVAFDCGNMEPVARTLRAKFPDAQIVVCADNDQFTEGNPGLSKANRAARAVGGLLAYPEFAL